MTRSSLYERAHQYWALCHELPRWTMTANGALYALLQEKKYPQVRKRAEDLCLRLWFTQNPEGVVI